MLALSLDSETMHFHQKVAYHSCSDSSDFLSDSICCFSDDLDHHVTILCQTISCIVDFIKWNISNIMNLFIIILTVWHGNARIVKIF